MQSDFEQYAGEIRDGLMTDSEWEPPIPFDEVHTPDFPTEKLPGPLEAMVECLSESTQTPEEMSGLLSLGVLATAFQSKYEVEVTPDWMEPLCLYCAAVAPPGERKSAAIAALTRPIYEYEAEQRKLDAPEIARNESERKMLEGMKAAAETAAVKGKAGEREAKRKEALDLAAQLAEFEIMHEYRLLADDTTPEKLVDLMEKQRGCITVCSAEGGVFDAMQGRYEKSLNLDIYLKAHAGDSVIVDRIGRKSNYIAAPRLTMMLTIQPEVLSGLMNNSTFRGRGLCGRFLYAMCRSRVGRRNVSPEPVPDSVRMEYRDFVRRILSINSINSTDRRGVIRLSPEADELRRSYQEYIERRLGDEWENMRDWGGKLTGAMVRVAALMHCAEAVGDPTQTPVSAETMYAATCIAEYLAANATAAYQVMGADDGAEDAKYIIKRLAGRESITRSELTHLCRGRFTKSDEMDPSLDILEDRGYIRAVENPVGYNNRRQIIYHINPALWRN